MKNILLPAFTLLLVNMAAGQNQNNTSIENNKFENTYNTLYSNFTTPMLSQPELAAFNARAQQKVQDMLNYILLINNPEIGRQIREHAILQCRSLFREGAKITSREQALNVEQYLKKVLNQEWQLDTSRAMQMAVKQPLQPMNAGGYEGMISLTLSENPSNSKTKKTTTPVEKWAVKFYLLKIPKEFGDETIELWEVVFGDVTILGN